ncbi:MAG: DUF2148 domain-containing protein [Candidatus Omnitrophica bacterium]|nr:DUF2148 domain-containing protein [Candidatus Omnitrophota bacterium]
MNYKKEMKTAIDLISISVRTAPKSGGIDDVVFLALSERQKNSIAREMVRTGKDKAKNNKDKVIKNAIEASWSSDAETVNNSQGLVLIGVRGKKAVGINCGACGFGNCKGFRAYASRSKAAPFTGPFCVLKIMDLGIAISSAAKTASMLNVDNRIMYRAGVAAEKLGIFRQDFSKPETRISPVLGLPLSASGKNIYFDRLEKLEAGKILMNYFKANK